MVDIGPVIVPANGNLLLKRSLAALGWSTRSHTDSVRAGARFQHLYVAMVFLKYTLEVRRFEGEATFIRDSCSVVP